MPEEKTGNTLNASRECLSSKPDYEPTEEEYGDNHYTEKLIIGRKSFDGGAPSSPQIEMDTQGKLKREKRPIQSVGPCLLDGCRSLLIVAVGRSKKASHGKEKRPSLKRRILIWLQPTLSTNRRTFEQILFVLVVALLLAIALLQLLLTLLLGGGTELGPKYQFATNISNPSQSILLSTNEEVSCVAWRATDNCSPDGPRLSQNMKSFFADTDLTCSDYVPSFGSSGYCELETKSGRTIKAFQKSCAYGKEGPLPLWKHFVPYFHCNQAVHFLNYKHHVLQYRPRRELTMTTSLNDENPTRGILIQIYPSCLPSVYAIIKLLREVHNCRLPLELWYTQGEISDEHPMLKHLVKTFENVELRIIAATEMAADSNSYMSKPYAIAYSHFDQILFLDSDNFPIIDPTFLFETPEFKEKSAMFWKDFWNPRRNDYTMTLDSLVWELLGIPVGEKAQESLPPNHEMEMESGQMFIDRRKSVAALHALLYLSKTFSDWLEPLVLVWGDKDLFRLAYYMTSTPFHYIPEPPGLAGKDVALKWLSYDKVCGNTMVQHAPNGDAVFFHRNTAKLSTKSDLVKVWQKGVKFVGNHPNTEYAVEGSPSYYRLHGCFHPKVPAREYFKEIDYRGSNVEVFEERILSFAKEGLDIMKEKY